MARSLYKSSCCGALLESYKIVECPQCGKGCKSEEIDIDPPDNFISSILSNETTDSG